MTPNYLKNSDIISYDILKKELSESINGYNNPDAFNRGYTSIFFYK